MTPGTDSFVRLEEHDRIVELRFDRPEKLNAIHDPLLEDLHAALTRVSEAPSKPLLVTGEGRVTCAGRDVETVSDPDYEPHPLQPDLSPLLAAYPYPTAMAGKGAVVGQAFLLSLQCDFFVVGEGTTLTMPEIKFDIDTSEYLERLAAIVGNRVATEIVATGDEISPERSYELGLANDIVPEDAVDVRAREFLSDLAENDAGILRSIVERARLDGE